MKSIAVVALATVCLCGCGKFLHGMIGGPRYIGSGKIKTESRPVGDFHKIEIGGATSAEVQVGPKPSLQIITDDNLQIHVRTRVENGALVIDHEGSYTSDYGIKAVVTVPNLDAVEVTGGGKMTLEGLQASRMHIELSGAAKLNAKGSAEALDIEASGASKAELSGVSSQRAKVEASGASDVILAAANEIVGELSGASHLRYSGHPKVSVETNGSSTVSQS